MNSRRRDTLQACLFFCSGWNQGEVPCVFGGSLKSCATKCSLSRKHLSKPGIDAAILLCLSRGADGPTVWRRLWRLAYHLLQKDGQGNSLTVSWRWRGQLPAPPGIWQWSGGRSASHPRRGDRIAADHSKDAAGPRLAKGAEVHCLTGEAADSAAEKIAQGIGALPALQIFSPHGPGDGGRMYTQPGG